MINDGRTNTSRNINVIDGIDRGVRIFDRVILMQ